MPTDSELVDQVLTAALYIFEEMESRRATIEQKATSLLGATSLAATLLAAASAVLLQASDFADRGELLPFGIIVIVALSAFLYAGYKAMRSLLVTQWGSPNPEVLLATAELNALEFKRRWIGQLLRARTVNERVAATKGGWLGEAQAWFVLGMLMLVVAAGVLLSTVVVFGGPDGGTPETPTATPVAINYSHSMVPGGLLVMS